MAESLFNKSLKIAQFDGTNFSNWKYRIGILLQEKELEQFVGSNLNTILAAELDVRKHAAIKLNEKKCMSVIVQSIHDNQLEYIRDQRTAKGMWDSLCKIFERKSVATQVLVRKQLLSMKYHESEDMTEFLLLFDKRIRELKSMDTLMRELDVIVHLLLTMPSEYETLVTALETLDPDKLTIEFVKTRLLDEHNKRRNFNPIKSNDSGAMMAGKMSKNIICNYCKKPGHMKFQCFFLKKKLNIENEENAHRAENCEEEAMSAFLIERVSETKSKDKIKFILDSGASQHMVNDKCYFQKLENIHEINISVAKKNEKVSANQQGDITIKTLYKGDTSSKKIENVLFVPTLTCNLLSVRNLTIKGYRIEFNGDYAYVSLRGKMKFIGQLKGNQYEVIFHLHDENQSMNHGTNSGSTGYNRDKVNSAKRKCIGINTKNKKMTSLIVQNVIENRSDSSISKQIEENQKSPNKEEVTKKWLFRSKFKQF